ncbi:dystrophin-like [Mya arenaria]|uniref:dystrophin-like n=1 Tax=Mya arenaria TaxID=6604 RepID=UPI0022E84525|nr:dystrophin-like [Mya arenaria]
MDDFSCYDRIVDGWERTDTDTGVPYFINHLSECTSWDHPYWTKLLEGLGEFDSVKYAAYRTALKVQYIQRHLHLDELDVYSIQQELEDAGYTPGSRELLGCDDIVTLLLSIYSHTHNTDRQLGQVEKMADLMLNFVLNLYDKNKMGLIPVLSVKILLVTMSGAKLTDKYRYLYQELHDPSTFVGTRALGEFLNALMKIPDFLKESLAFGRTTDPAVASCVQMGTDSGGVTEDVFYRWLQREPQTVVWLPTLHRIMATQHVVHNVKCSVCKVYPLVGLRYQCLQCFKFSLCQSCFFRGKTRKNHKPKHPTREYCTSATAKDDTAAFMKTLKNNLSRKHRRKSAIKYMPVEADSQYTNLAWSPGKQEEGGGDIHQDISQTARRLAEIERLDSHTQTTPLPTDAPLPDGHHPWDRTLTSLSPPSTLTYKENISPLSAKEDGFQREREELNNVILGLQEENRALYEQLASLEPYSDTDSLPSKHPDPSARSPVYHSPPPYTLSNNLLKLLKESQNLPVREPLPHEATPIYLSVPIIRLPSQFSDSAPTSPGSEGSLPQPNFSTLDSSATYSIHSPAVEEGLLTPPRERTLADSLDALDASPGRFSLPSPCKSTDGISPEEDELKAIVEKVDKFFPSDLSYGRPVSRQSEDEDDMLRAATSISQAMSAFVSQAVNPPLMPSLDLILQE